MHANKVVLTAINHFSGNKYSLNLLSIPKSVLDAAKIVEISCYNSFIVVFSEDIHSKKYMVLIDISNTESFYKLILDVIHIPTQIGPSNISFSDGKNSIFLRYFYQEKEHIFMVNKNNSYFYINFDKPSSGQVTKINRNHFSDELEAIEVNLRVTQQTNTTTKEFLGYSL